HAVTGPASVHSVYMSLRYFAHAEKERRTVRHRNLIMQLHREMKRMLQRLLARSATDDKPMQLPENISLPIGTFEQMEEFEEHLGDEARIHLF
ncbi:hypothetical protein DPMN_136356, partial [Dreissena polymorpha]